MTPPPAAPSAQRTPARKKDEVYQEIRAAITSGGYKPGAMLYENELAAHYAISRTPVREALLMLVVEGLLRSLPRAGYIVTDITVQDVHESFHLREVLEAEAASLAAGRISAGELAALEAKKIDVGSAPRLYNRDFHLMIAHASGNARLARIVADLLDDMERILAYDPHLSNPHDLVEHEAILVALRAGDAAAARDAMRAHVRAVRDRVLKRF